MKDNFKIELDEYEQQSLLVEDLLQCKKEWSATPEIVQLTFRAIINILKNHDKIMKDLENIIPTRASKQEVQNGLLQKANVSDVSSAIEQLADSLEGKLSSSDVTQSITEYFTNSQLKRQLDQKVGKAELKVLLDEKVALADIKKTAHVSDQEIFRLEGRIQSCEDRMAKKLDKKNKSILILEEKLQNVSNELQSSILSRIAESEQNVSQKNNKQIESLSEQLESLKQDQKCKTQQFQKNQAQAWEDCKSQQSMLAEDLNQLASQSTANFGKIQQKIEVLKSQVQASMSKSDMEMLYQEIDKRTADKNFINDQINCTKNDIYEDLVGLKQELEDTKQLLSHQNQSVVKSLKNSDKKIGALKKQKQTRTDSELNELREDITRLNQMRAADLQDITSAMEKQTDFLMLQIGQEKETANQNYLMLKEQCKEDIINVQKDKNFADKQNFKEIYSILEKMVAEIHTKVAQTDFSEDQRQLKDVLNEIQRTLLLKVPTEDLTAQLHGKASSAEVVQLSNEINRIIELQQTPQNNILEQYVNKEGSLGRWVWKSGDLVNGSCVPWELESINTMTNNFIWEQNKSAITVLLQGCYQIQCVFFSKPSSQFSYQILINGNCVKKKAVKEKDTAESKYQKKHQQHQHAIQELLVAQEGISYDNFYIVPQKSRISFNYNGQFTGQGFLMIKKI